MTPEGRTKAKVNRLLSQFPDIYRFMSVPMGYGPSTLDYLICCKGRFIAIETKSLTGKLTDRQHMIVDQITAAGGIVFIVRNDDDVARLESWLKAVHYDDVAITS